MSLYGYDRFFYHYTRADTAFSGIVHDGNCTLRLNAYRNMRDPFEARDWAWRIGFGDDWVPSPGAQSSVLDGFETIKGRTKVLSLTVDAAEGTEPERSGYGWGFAHARLWEHYADNHQGVCLVFERGLLTELMRSKLQPLGPVLADRMQYRLGWPLEDDDALNVDNQRVFATVEPSDWSDRLEQGAYKHLQLHGADLYFRKLDDWKSENEFRFACLDNTVDDFVPVSDLADALFGVILGYRFPTWQIPAAQQALENTSDKAKLGFVHWAAGKAHLQYQPGFATRYPGTPKRFDYPTGLPYYVRAAFPPEE